MERLIPQAPFAEMPQVMLLILVAAAIWILMRGADMLVEAAATLAHRLGIPKIVVAATIISLGTTSPEAAVSVMAAWEGKPGLALGNAVGSIVADTGLIFGLGCVLVLLPADRNVLMRQGWWKIGSGFLLAVLCYALWMLHGDTAELGRGVGCFLLVLLVLYIMMSIRWSRRGITTLQEDDVPQDTKPMPTVTSTTSSGSDVSVQITAQLVGQILVGIILVILSSRFLIASVTVLAQSWGMSEVTISATLVALGTSLPELVVGMTAIIRGHPAILVGNVIGADILNVLFVVGASAVATPLRIVDGSARIPEIFLCLHLPAMMIMLTLFLAYIIVSVRTGTFRRWYGIPLLMLYAAYVLTLLTLGTTATQ